MAVRDIVEYTEAIKNYVDREISQNGIHLNDVSSFNLLSTTGVQKITITWQDPEDIIADDTTLAEWGGTVIVRKVGTPPTSIYDGTIIVDSTVKNQYSENGFDDTNIEFDTLYYYRAFPYTTNKIYTNGDFYSVEVAPIHIYGVEWDGTANTSWTRTDDATEFEDPNPYYAGMTGIPSSPFDDIFPWSEMIREERDGGTMVKIPRFWYKLTYTNPGMKIQIADGPVDGFSVSPTHMDRGDGKGERGVMYIGRYRCNSASHKSDPSAYYYSDTRANTRNVIHQLGANIWQSDFATRFTIWLLYLVEFADWNSQAKIGYGCGYGQGQYNGGAADSIPYHTGTTQTSRTTYGLGIQYRNIVELWDNSLEWMDGCVNNSSGLWIRLNPSSFSDSAGGTLIGKPVTTTYGAYPKTFDVSNNLFPLFYPTKMGGNGSNYSCDSWIYSTSNVNLLVGSDGQSQAYGLFYVSGTDTSMSRKCRLMELP